MLLVGVGTLVGTIALYIVVPKGFLPQQDTGVVVAVTEAGAEHLHPPPERRCRPRPRRIVRSDPAVTGVVSLRRRRHDQRHAQHRPPDHRAEAGRQRDPSAGGDRRALQRRLIADIPGLSAFLQPVQDIQIGTRISRTQFQYTLMDTDQHELAHWAPRLLDSSAGARAAGSGVRPAE